MGEEHSSLYTKLAKRSIHVREIRAGSRFESPLADNRFKFLVAI